MGRVVIGVVLVAVGIVLGLVGQPLLGADLHPVTTGLIAIGLVAIGVGVAERRFDGRARVHGHHSDERVR
ncbi:MAG: hypothetical protein IT385_10200 [Deltaproteobacteria bacterium]|nr:hypothetical protein [Deltaproteobacteria bacterium]